jgi:hypothetical protein
VGCVGESAPGGSANEASSVLVAALKMRSSSSQHVGVFQWYERRRSS